MDYKNRILENLSLREIPCDIEKIRIACGIGNWNTALHHLLELYIEGEIQGKKSSKSWVFWLEKPPHNSGSHCSETQQLNGGDCLRGCRRFD